MGIDLGTVTFEASFQNTIVGRTSLISLVLQHNTNLFHSVALAGGGLSLAPESVTNLHLAGRIVPQSGPDLDTIGTLFSNFLAGENQTLSVAGLSVQPPGSSSPVSWLSTAFKTLTLMVNLPGEKFTVTSTRYLSFHDRYTNSKCGSQIIQSIAISDLEVEITSQDEAFAPDTSSTFTLAQYKNPFGFSLQVIESGENITLSSGGTAVAEVCFRC